MTIRVLTDAAVHAHLGEVYVEPMTTEDGRRFYRAAHFGTAIGGGTCSTPMGDWTRDLTEACDAAREVRATIA